jgi:hypothetical protein
MTIEYTVREDDGELATCDCCNCPAPVAEFPIHHTAVIDKETRLLCKFCSYTMASRHTEYPADDLYTQLRADIWRAAAGVYNMLKYEGLLDMDPTSATPIDKPTNNT